MKYFFTFLFSYALAFAIPNTINYQGILTDSDGNSVANSIYSATFSFYDDETNGILQWQEEQSFITNNGVFNIELGSITPFGDLKFDEALWLEIHLEGEDAPLADRIPIRSSAFSISAKNVFEGEIQNSIIGNITPAAATFTDLEISGEISASSSTLMINSIEFGSSTLYIPNSINNGSVLTSNGNGKATWQSIPNGVNLSNNEEITGNWSNTQNPWADNEVADELTISGGSINNTEIGNITPAGATFTDLEISGDISASSSTMLISSLEFGSSTLYIPNSINNGSVLTSNGNGKATWQSIPNGVNLSNNEEITGNWSNTQNPWADNEIADDLTISSGTINNTEIGNITPAGATFTTLAFTNNPNDGYVLTSDANGTASWQEASSGGGSSSNTYFITLQLDASGFSVNDAYIGNGAIGASVNSQDLLFPMISSGTLTTIYFGASAASGSTTISVTKNNGNDLIDWEAVDIQNGDQMYKFNYDNASFNAEDILNFRVQTSSAPVNVSALVYIKFEN